MERYRLENWICVGKINLTIGTFHKEYVDYRCFNRLRYFFPVSR
jgi:hypothetical protein